MCTPRVLYSTWGETHGVKISQAQVLKGLFCPWVTCVPVLLVCRGCGNADRSLVGSAPIGAATLHCGSPGAGHCQIEFMRSCHLSALLPAACVTACSSDTRHLAHINGAPLWAKGPSTVVKPKAVELEQLCGTVLQVPNCILPSSADPHAHCCINDERALTTACVNSSPSTIKCPAKAISSRAVQSDLHMADASSVLQQISRDSKTQTAFH